MPRLGLSAAINALGRWPASHSPRTLTLLHGEYRFEEEPHMAAIYRLIGLQSALLSLQEHLTEHSQPRFESHIA